MIAFQEEDWWASANTIQHFFEIIGIKSHVTSEVLLPDMMIGGHKNTLALIDGNKYM